MSHAETRIAWQGLIDSRPMVFYEDPEHMTFRMRSDSGQFLEVFVPTELLRETPQLFALGKHIALTGDALQPGESPQSPILVFATSAKAG